MITSLVFVSNFLNHHQYELCIELSKRVKKFNFIATEEIPLQTKKFGYHDMNENTDFVICSYKNKESLNYSLELIQESEIVIFGSCPNYMIDLRMKKNRISFLYTERFFKKSILRRFYPPTYKKVSNRVLRYKDDNMFVLCASAYASHDLLICGFPKKKCFKWGYFPEFIPNDIKKRTIKKECKVRILWVGRFLNWKNPRDAIKLAKLLKKNNYDFVLDFIGAGPEEKILKEMVIKNKLDDNIRFLGSMHPENVRKHMLESDIFLFTSGKYEGWGAVLNEAMNSMCAVVASNKAGSVPYLIKDGINGYSYKCGKISELYLKTKLLIENKQTRLLFGERAYKTIQNVWNCKYAVDNLMYLIENMHQENFEYLIKDGPCSLAYYKEGSKVNKKFLNRS